MILYNLRTAGSGWTIAKFDDDFNVESIYQLTPKASRTDLRNVACNCPMGQKNIVLKPCRHRKMLQLMHDRADTDWFFCFDDGTWHQPLSEEGLASPTIPAQAKAAPPTPPSVPMVAQPKPSNDVIRRRI